MTTFLILTVVMLVPVGAAVLVIVFVGYSMRGLSIPHAHRLSQTLHRLVPVLTGQVTTHVHTSQPLEPTERYQFDGGRH